jgi:glycosyltransferase involved in cell wall biosynthesis
MSVGTVDRDVGQERMAAPQPSQATQADETISIVLPCLNEEESIAHCIAWAQEGLARTGLPGEIIVVDNGSTDRSAELARAAGARVLYQPLRGYGNAYHKGLAAATGTYIVMGDADQTYDFREIDHLIAPLRAGYDYVLGSRFRGTILPGAMPWTHRYIGNPLLTLILNLLFGLKSSDAHSGLRAFTRAAYLCMGLTCPGMEFASELVVKAAQARLRVVEVPITYHPRAGSSKLRALHDGWRHLRFMVAYRFARTPQPDDGRVPALSFGSDDDVALNK